MTAITRTISRRAALGAGGLALAGSFLQKGTPAMADDVAPVDRGRTVGGKTEFPPIAAPSEAQDRKSDAPLPPSERVGFALVALGRLTIEEIIPAFARTKKCKISALVSGSPDKLRATGAQLGLPDNHLHSYDAFERLAQNKDVQAIYIVLPNSMHKDYVLRAAAIGRHVLCEKPMATSVADAHAMIEACHRSSVRLMIAYRCRYEPHHLELIKRAQSGDLGRIKMITAVNSQNQGDPAQWRLKKALSGGGALPDVGIYCLNAARAVTGEEPASIAAQMTSTPGDPRFAEVEEAISWTMRFPSGTLANLSTSYASHRSSFMQVDNERGSLRLDQAFPYKGQRLHAIQAIKGVENDAVIQIPAADHFALELDHMADCVMRDETPRTAGEEGLRDMVLMDAIYRAARSGETIRF